MVSSGEGERGVDRQSGALIVWGGENVRTAKGESRKGRNGSSKRNPSGCMVFQMQGRVRELTAGVSRPKKISKTGIGKRSSQKRKGGRRASFHNKGGVQEYDHACRGWGLRRGAVQKGLKVSDRRGGWNVWENGFELIQGVQLQKKGTGKREAPSAL